MRKFLFLIITLTISVNLYSQVEKEYYSNGQLELIGRYNADGDEIGEWKGYYENGQLEYIGSYDREGNETGEWKYYYENGQLESIELYDDQSNETGEWKTYYEDGQLESIGKYEDGIKIGDWKDYYENGQLEMVINYVDNTERGEMKYYTENGKLKATGITDHGEFEGEFKTYFEDGSIESIQHYQNGKRSGTMKTYYQNGQIRAIGKCSNGKQNGEWIYYSENGILSAIGEFANGDKIRKWKYYDESGQLTSTKYYNEKGKFFDNRDGKVYQTVKIGNQLWMAENLNYYTSDGSWCAYNNDKYCKKYGRLYDWPNAVKLCPKGWHLPSKQEFETLIESVGGAYSAEALQSTKGWDKEHSEDSNSSGFNALPEGNYYSTGSFHFPGMGSDASFWTSTTPNRINVYYFEISEHPSSTKMHVDYVGSKTAKYEGRSVRCIKD